MDMKKVKKLIASKAVVFATCAAAGAAILPAASQAGIKFKTVVVDEATQVGCTLHQDSPAMECNLTTHYHRSALCTRSTAAVALSSAHRECDIVRSGLLTVVAAPLVALWLASHKGPLGTGSAHHQLGGQCSMHTLMSSMMCMP